MIAEPYVIGGDSRYPATSSSLRSFLEHIDECTRGDEGVFELRPSRDPPPNLTLLL